MSVVKRGTADNFFRKKLPGAKRHEGARHTAYAVYSPSGRAILGNLAFSRSAPGEDLHLNNVKGLSDDLGMSLDGFIQACNCHIRATVVVACVAARVISQARDMHELDPKAFDERMIDALGKSLDAWFAEIEPSADELRPRESKELIRGQSRLNAIDGNRAVQRLVQRLNKFVEEKVNL